MNYIGADYNLMNEDELIEKTANEISKGKAIGWFQGRMEFGPRALGGRSILGDARSSIMQKNLSAKLLAKDKKYFLSVKSKVLDGRTFITGKVDTIEEKFQITKIAWEIKGTRSVKNDLKIKEKFNFKQSAKDILITSQLKSALIFNKKTKAVNYNIDTYKKNIYIYGIARSSEERSEVIDEAKQILDVKKVVASIFLVDDLRIQKN